MKQIMLMLKGTQGVFAKVYELRNSPLLADIYEDITDAGNMQYIGPEEDRVNFRRDMHSWAGDFRSAFFASRQRLGA